MKAAGNFAAAASAYERARDADALVRLLIEKLNAATRAQEIVRSDVRPKIKVDALQFAPILTFTKIVHL